jgi:murein DD-endopeptidase MepM/ murein hydrolase activator NlpD
MSTVDPLAVGRMMSNDLSQVQRNQIASEEFEAYLIEMMLKEMRKTVPKGMFSSSTMDLFTEMMDKAVARDIAESGGLGLADNLLGEFEEAENSGIGAQMAHESVPIIRKIHEHNHSALHQEHNEDKIIDNVQRLIGNIPVSGRLTSDYGMRKHPIKGTHKMHTGIDIGASKGTDINNALEGKVVFAGRRGGYGNTIIVEHKNGWSTLYAHCDSLNVNTGDFVKKGELIGKVGTTGLSTGPHLHFELKQDGKNVDPLEVFQWSFE